MKPIKLTLKGFAGIASGQGKEEITLDLETIPQEAQLVAIAGPNGAGKTTLMDNLQPYRLMPSRASSPTPGGFSFYEHIVGGEGSKELDWEFKGVRYKSMLRFRATAKTKKTEAYLFVIGEDGSQTPWSDPATGMLSDGKAATYDEAVEAILGKPEVFFSAQFSAQGRAPIGAMTSTEVKSLIAEMIGSSKSAELAAKASDVAKGLRPRQSALTDEAARLKEQMPEQQELDSERLGMEAKLAEAEQQRQLLQQKSDSLVGRIASAQANEDQIKAAENQHAAFQREAQAFELEVGQAEQALAEERQRAQAAHQQRLVVARQAQTDAASVVKAAAEQINRLNKAVEGEAAIGQAKQRLNELQLRNAELRQVIERCQPQALLMERVQGEITEISGKLASTKSDGTHVAQALKQAQETASLLSEVPCQGTDLSGRCKLLAHANDAGEKVPELTVKVTGLRKSFATLRDQSDTLTQRLNELKQAKEQLDAANRELASVALEVQKAEAIVATEAAVIQARQDLPAAGLHLEEAQARSAQAGQQLQAIEQELEQIALDFQTKAKQLERQHAEKRERLQAMRQALPALNQGDDVTQLRQQAAQVSQDMKALESSKVLTQEALARNLARMEALQQQRIQLAALEAKIKAMADEISQWTLLAKALGTNGIIAMSIDDAGPAIAQYANELLDDCYGGRFTISLLTQQHTQAGIAKEAFLIQVEDNHRGENKLLDAMSGGEKVWINECLVRGLALYMAEVADSRSQTLFSDESDGALDPQRKREYMAMKRAVIERGGYEREYLITQTPELLEMCDAVIDVSKQ